MTDTDFKSMAGRHAADLLAELELRPPIETYDLLHGVLAAAWLKGYEVGARDTLGQSMAAFAQLETDLRTALS